MDNKGNISACKRCSGYICCGNIREGGPIEPPFLTASDIVTIEYYSGLKKEQFSKAKINPVTNNKIYIMDTKKSGGCTFFNKQNGKCKIHSFRPMDCRLFPLDIELIEKKYFWALFNCKSCDLSPNDLQSLLSYKNEALEILGDELHDYATIPVPGMNKIGYKIFKEIEL